jgi:hypothetical protein
MVLLIEDKFYQPIREAGVAEDQVFFDFLPVDRPPMDTSTLTFTERYDVGFVKTMTHELDLPEITMVLGREKLSEAECHEMRQIQKRIELRIEQNGFVDFRECRMWSPNSLWLNGCVSFTHERLCEYFVRALAEDGYSLGLTGNNWNKFPHLAEYSLGYARTREEYYSRFFDNKINLSINPWDIYHPRILEGGWCGAFFLIHKMPDDVAWQHLPKQMRAGEHFEYFETREELREKVAYYLKHSEERKRIGRNLQDLVQSEFTYESYCRLLMERFRHLLIQNGTDPLQPSQPSAAGAS